MINYDLPKEIAIDDKTYPITKDGDYRLVLDIITALNDDDLPDNAKTVCCLLMFYGEIPGNTREAVNKMMWFINCGNETDAANGKPPIMSWEQDFHLLVPPINRALGTEIRSVSYLHWWSFVSGYMEIGECRFSTVASIRQKKRKGIKLENWEREFYNENRKEIDLKVRYTKEETEFLKSIGGI